MCVNESMCQDNLILADKSVDNSKLLSNVSKTLNDILTRTLELFFIVPFKLSWTIPILKPEAFRER